MSCCAEEGARGPLLAPTWQGRAVLVRYLGRVPVRVTGSVTGRSYSFSAHDAQQPVDRQDVPALLHSRWFHAVRVIATDTH